MSVSQHLRVRNFFQFSEFTFNSKFKLSVRVVQMQKKKKKPTKIGQMSGCKEIYFKVKLRKTFYFFLLILNVKTCMGFRLGNVVKGALLTAAANGANISNTAV